VGGRKGRRDKGFDSLFFGSTDGFFFLYKHGESCSVLSVGVSERMPY